MRLNKYLKFFLMMVPSLTRGALTEAKALEPVTSRVPLPPECNGLDHIKGVDPLNAKTVVFGELHNDIKCQSSIAKCARALSKGMNKKNILGLLENVPNDMQTTCLSFSSALKFPSIVGECKGWNHPSSLKFADLVAEQMALKIVLVECVRIKDSYKEQLNEFSEDAALAVISFFKKNVQVISEQIAKLQKAEITEFDSFKLKNKEANFSKFFFSEKPIMMITRVSLELSKTIVKDLSIGIPLIEVMFILSNKLIEKNLKINKAGEDLNTFLTKPNESLVKTLKAEASKKQKIYPVVGLGHVKRTPNVFGAKQKEIIAELYRELDKFSDKNPYSVLVCREP